MNSWLQGVGIIVAAIVSLVGLFISIRNRKRDTKAVEAKTSLDETQQASIVKQLADSTEVMYLKRLESFKDDIRLMRAELDAARKDSESSRLEVSLARDEARKAREEASLFEDFFFNHHSRWDRTLLMIARENGWEIPDPPSWLIFLRSKGMNDDD
ncbi:membrane protein [Mycobacterium phage MrMiyagi]|uniref:Membrane protein n=1 Tax=Mycobacterium phage MrMiyagi TaxID=2762395 RepID=A0A7G8LPS5_9CAUD|nr:membrane protein [Mycobacterium phage MrMiyagi]